MRVATLVLCTLLAVLPACQGTPAPLPAQPPPWIENPEHGAVGSATTHVRGRHYQEALAITRARERLAARYGVRISSVSTITESVRNDTLYVRADHDIRQVMESQEVRAHVRAVWHDKLTDTVWVWLYPITP